jgi:hypothetical protein
MGRMFKEHKEYLKTVGKYFHLILYQFVLDNMDKEQLDNLIAENGLVEVCKDGKVVYHVQYKVLFNRANRERVEYNKSKLS